MIRAGRKQPQPGYKTAKAVIEEIPNVGKYEAILEKIRRKTGFFTVLDGKRTKDNAEAIISKNARSITHTHIKGQFWRVFRNRTLAIPSDLDLQSLFGLALNKKKPYFFHIASIDRKSKVIGVTSVGFTKKFYESETERNKAFYIINGFKTDSGKLALLMKRGIVRVKFRPMPGYEIKESRFVKKEQ